MRNKKTKHLINLGAVCFEEAVCIINNVFLLLQQLKTNLTATVASVVVVSRTVAVVGSCLTTVTQRSASIGSSPTGTYHTTKSPITVSTVIFKQCLNM